MLDCIPRYGYPGLFSLLVLGIIGLPVPDETLLAFAGYLVSQHVLRPVPTAAAALFGSLCGITVSYTIGRFAGVGLVRRYGAWVHITPARLHQIRSWFERIGRWTLLIGYYIPGVRHLIALVAGASSLRYPVFALFAYIGGAIWTGTFLYLGYALGRHWETALASIHRHLLLATFAAAAIVVAFLLTRRVSRPR